MLPILPTSLKIDDISLQKLSSINKIEKVLDIVDPKPIMQMVKTASTNPESQLSQLSETDRSSLIALFSNMLACLNIKMSSGTIEDLMKKLSNSNMVSENGLNKTAKQNKTSQDRKDEIKIVSKSIKDSHYQIDVSKDLIVRKGKRVFMVSCYARDAYLGRYLIKRNFFYTAEREKFADNAYDEITSKVNAIKERYYSEIIDVSSLFSQMKQTLDGVVSEITIEEDSIATNINR